MENTENLLPEYSAKPKFKQTKATEKDWLEIGRWSRFFAIYGFIYLGVNLIGLIYISVMLAPYLNSPLFQLPPSLLWSFGILLLIVIGGLVTVYLGSRHHLQYAQDIKRALAFGDQALLTSAWKHLKGAWKVYGIYTIIIVSFYFTFLTAIGYLMENSPFMRGF